MPHWSVDQVIAWDVVEVILHVAHFDLHLCVVIIIIRLSIFLIFGLNFWLLTRESFTFKLIIQQCLSLEIEHNVLVGVEHHRYQNIQLSHLLHKMHHIHFSVKLLTTQLEQLLSLVNICSLISQLTFDS